MPQQQVKLQAIVLLLFLGVIFAFAVAGAVFVVRAVIRHKNEKAAESTARKKWSVRVIVPLIGLAVGLLVPMVLSLRLGEWAWIDLARAILFGFIGAFFFEMIARLFRKI
ncbi:MAG: hypothetical protein ACKN85_10185 [Pirellula sp.]